MKTSMISPVRQLAGLGCPPLPYTTNRNESMNNVAKSYADYRRSSWIQLIDNMFDLVIAQSNEVEKAVIGMGEYQFKPAYKHLEVSSNKWLMMSTEQRQKHLKKIFLIESSVFEMEEKSLEKNGKNLSILPGKCGITTLSSELLEKTWRKAEKLLNTPGSICSAPGLTDSMCVASDTGSRPHIHVVSRTKKGSFACDNECLAWKTQKLCSHVLAVSENAGCLPEFLSCYRRMKSPGNYTATCSHNQPKGVGKKPGEPRRKGPSYKKPDIEEFVDPFEIGRTNLETVPHPAPRPAAPQSPLVSTGQICQLNISPQNMTTPFQYNPQPPNVQQQRNNLSTSPFSIKFLTAAIKICAGCRAGFARAVDGKSCLPPPYDLCLVHKEQHLYYNVVNGRQQLSALNNVHYHANTTCPKARFPAFAPNSVQVPQELISKLKASHWSFLFDMFQIEHTEN